MDRGKAGTRKATVVIQGADSKAAILHKAIRRDTDGAKSFKNRDTVAVKASRTFTPATAKARVVRSPWFP
jgi:hypothetical protein